MTCREKAVLKGSKHVQVGDPLRGECHRLDLSRGVGLVCGTKRGIIYP